MFGSNPRLLLAALSAALCLACPSRRATDVATGAPPPAAARATPRLVVVLVVDQMRGDYLDRFAHELRDGLARLREHGAVFKDSSIPYAVTMTAPGHATVVTGSTPRRHGIIQNEWLDRDRRVATYAAADADAPIVGPPGVDTAALQGRSPAALLQGALGDWLKRQVPQSKVYALAFKDRASVLMGGERPDGAFWYEPSVPGYVSSSYYGPALPAWLLEFNASPALDAGYGEPWRRTLSPERYDFIGADAVATEGDGVHTTFPHRLGAASDDDAAARASYRKALGGSPRGDALTLELAKRLIAGERLGEDDAPDLLMISLSSADIVGHSFGPDSHELVDYYLHLDRHLGDLLRHLDASLPGDYALVLTSDHGVAPLPEITTARGGSAGRVLGAAFDADVQGAIMRVAERLGLEQPFTFFAHNEAIWLDLSAAPGLDPAATRAAVAAELRALPYLVDAYTYEDLAGQTHTPDRPWLELYRRGFVPTRSPDVQVQSLPGWLVNNRPRGTSHGTPYAYDREVPIIFFGAQVPAGWRFEPASTVDIAPTIAALLGIEAPADIDGKRLAF